MGIEYLPKNIVYRKMDSDYKLSSWVDRVKILFLLTKILSPSGLGRYLPLAQALA
jgi:hypothetical protein